MYIGDGNSWRLNLVDTIKLYNSATLGFPDYWVVGLICNFVGWEALRNLNDFEQDRTAVICPNSYCEHLANVQAGSVVSNCVKIRAAEL